MSGTIPSFATNVLQTQVSSNDQSHLSHRTRKRIREAKKKARPGKDIIFKICIKK